MIQNYNKIRYSGYTLTDISKRINISKLIKNDPNLYNEYNIIGNETASNIAQDFYDDPKLDWIIFLANNIIDPFYGWLLSDQEFGLFLRGKYGSDLEINNEHHRDPFSGTVITNFEYESKINESKRRIKIIKPESIKDIEQQIKAGLNGK